MEEWRRLIVRFELNAGKDFPDWLNIIHELTTRLIGSPGKLALFSYAGALAFSLLFEGDTSVMRLWQAACIASDAHNRAPYKVPYETNAKLLAQSIRSKTLDDTGLARTHKRARLALDVPESFDKAGPAARAMILATGGNTPGSIQAFLSTGDAVNILRKAEYSLKPIASGIQCWISFCDLANIPYYPPTSARVFEWASLFNPGSSFGQYLARLIKGCHILGIPTDWNGDRVAAASKGLRQAQDLSFKFENYNFRASPRRFARHETLRSEFEMLGYLSFLFLIRVQSEGLPIQRASLLEPLLTKCPKRAQAYIGLRDIGGGISTDSQTTHPEKHTRYGPIMMRPRFCSGSILVPASLCPVHIAWPIIRERVLPNELFFSASSENQPHPVLKCHY